MTYNYSQHDADYSAPENAPTQPLDPPPVGKYVCQIVSAVVKMNDKSGYPELKIAAKILTGEHAGKMTFPSASYAPDLIKWLRQMVERLGYFGPGSGIPDAAPGFVGAKVEVAVVQKERFTNYYLNKRLDDLPVDGDPMGADPPMDADADPEVGAPEVGDPMGADPDDEEIPF